MPPDESARPLLSFDLDGVLARPPFGRNPTAQRNLALQPARAGRSRPPARSPLNRLLAATYFRWRYRGRTLLPGAAAALAAATAGHRVVVLTARNARGRPATEDWLREHGLIDQLDAVLMNDTGLSSPRFKRWAVEQHGIDRHVEDDPASAALVARAGVAVDLIDWPWNRGLDYPPGVRVHADLHALAASLRAGVEP